MERLKEDIERLKILIEGLKKINLPYLERKYKDYEFTEVFPKIKAMYEFFLKLENETDYFILMPLGNKRELENYLIDFINIAERIRDFDDKKPNALVDFTELVATANINFDYLYNNRINFNTYLLEKKAEEAESLLNSISVTVGNIKEAAGITAISAQVMIFVDEANEKKKTACRWLIASLVSFAVLFGILFWVFLELITRSGTEVSGYESLFTRVLLLSFASILVYQFLKNYNANMHQYSLNKHRANSLRTVGAFHAGTDDPEIKNAILLAATKAVFESGDTGYVSNKDSSSSLEVFTKMIGKDK